MGVYCCTVPWLVQGLGRVQALCNPLKLPAPSLVVVVALVLLVLLVLLVEGVAGLLVAAAVVVVVAGVVEVVVELELQAVVGAEGSSQYDMASRINATGHGHWPTLCKYNKS